MGSSEEKGKKAEGGEKAAKGDSGVQMKQNKMGLVCYAGFWVTGIIFLIIEKKNRVVRFHAMQALVTFGILQIIWGIASTFGNPLVWGFGLGWGIFSPLLIAGFVVFGIFFTIWWILWAVLMYRTYHGRMYRVPLFGDLAEKCLAKLDAEK
jgi:uncharacterized membrane protein